MYTVDNELEADLAGSENEAVPTCIYKELDAVLT
jgi:hypothetical protein